MINLRLADDEEAVVQHVKEVETFDREVIDAAEVLNRALEVQELLIRLRAWPEDKRVTALAAALTLAWISGERIEDARCALCLDLVHSEISNHEESSLLRALT